MLHIPPDELSFDEIETMTALAALVDFEFLGKYVGSHLPNITAKLESYVGELSNLCRTSSGGPATIALSALFKKLKEARAILSDPCAPSRPEDAA